MKRIKIQVPTLVTTSFLAASALTLAWASPQNSIEFDLMHTRPECSHEGKPTSWCEATDSHAAAALSGMEARAGQMAMATAEVAAQSDEVVDLTPRPAEVKAETVVGEVAMTDVDVSENAVEFRTNDTFAATLGHGNNYDFVEGQKVRAPKWVYDHLDEKGLIWH